MYNIQILEKLFGSSAKVKIMRLFLFNPNAVYDISLISRRANVPSSKARKEMSILENIGLVRKKTSFKTEEFKRKGKTFLKKKKINGWALDPKFVYLKPLQSFLIDIAPLRHEDILKKLSRVGRIKLIVVAGVFIQNFDSRVDILVVGDDLKKNSLENVIKTMESEVGKELKYSYFETEDFKYRFGMCDKLIRDILDYPHEKVVDKLGIQ